MPRATQAIIGANVVVFLLQQFSLGDYATIWFALWPINDADAFGNGIHFQPWQVITYSFLHGNVQHIFFNMFAVWMFGSALEQLFGERFYLSLYFVSVLTAAAAQLGVNALLGSPYPTLGASGGVFGLLLAYAMYFPHQRLLIFGIVPVPAWAAVTGYGAIELFLGVTGTQAGVAHFAHLGGMVGAFALIEWRRRWPKFPKRRR
jgi:membrane associated rhomboid family serine protease